MPSLTRKSFVFGTTLLLLFVLPWLANAIDEPFLISLFSRCLIYSLAALSLDLVLGYGGMVSFGHAAFFGIGGYVAGILTYHVSEDSPIFQWPFEWIGTSNLFPIFVFVVVIGSIFALLIGAVSLRTEGMGFIMITLAFAQMLYFFFVSFEPYGGDDGLSFYGNEWMDLDLLDDTTFYYLCLGFLLLAWGLIHRVTQARFGQVIVGSKLNEKRMKALGYPTFRYKLLCFVFSAIGMSIAGALMAIKLEFVSPDFLHWTQSGELMIMVILGGVGTLLGPILGAFSFLLMEDILSSYTEHWLVFFGPFLLLVVLFSKQGLYGILVGKD